MILILSLYIFLMCLSFYFLIKSSDYFISSSSQLGEKIGLNKFIIGITIVAIGTSFPELITVIIATFTIIEPSAFVFGTVIGSNIANILLVFPILILFSKNLKINFKKYDIYILILSTLILSYITIANQIYQIIGFILIIIYIYYIYRTIKNNKKDKIIQEVNEIKTKTKKKSTIILLIILLISIIVLNLSAKGVIYSIEQLGLLLTIPIEYLTLTTLAFATSLPEAVVTYTSAKKKEFDIAIGNIIGSNISNILLIVGFSTLIHKFSFQNSSYYLSIFFLITSVIIFIFYLKKKKITKRHAIIMLILYFIYLTSVFI
ncbi:MAG: calcium/sodium antiporter [Nanoarchaeota archaeon]